ncbi:probable protein phosphatase 2C 27, partial [Tanacetum coccineum]
LLKFETVAGMMSECLGMLSVSFKRFITSDCFYQMDSIGEITVDTCEKQSNFVLVLPYGDWSDIGKRSYMEDAHICIPNLAEKFGDQLPGKEIVSLYGGHTVPYSTGMYLALPYAFGRIYGRDPLLHVDISPKLLFSTPRKRKNIRYCNQEESKAIIQELSPMI